MTKQYTIWDDIYRVIEAGGLTEKVDIAEKVAENVPPSKVRAALLELLPQAVLQGQIRVRKAVLTPVSGDEQRDLASSGATARFRGLGPKNLIVHVPDDDGVYQSVRLGALTADDLLRLAVSYQDRATANRLQGKKYAALAEVVNSGVVDDVDEDVIRKVLA